MKFTYSVIYFYVRYFFDITIKWVTKKRRKLKFFFFNKYFCVLRFVFFEHFGLAPRTLNNLFLSFCTSLRRHFPPFIFYVDLTALLVEPSVARLLLSVVCFSGLSAFLSPDVAVVAHCWSPKLVDSFMKMLL